MWNCDASIYLVIAESICYIRFLSLQNTIQILRNMICLVYKTGVEGPGPILGRWSMSNSRKRLACILWESF